VDINTFIEKRIAKQLWLPFVEYYEPTKEKENTVILFHLPMMIKKTFAEQARLEGLSITGLLNTLISDYISSKVEKLKQTIKPTTGRGNVNEAEINLAKDYLRRIHPKTARLKDIADFAGVSNARARGLMDLLSGVSNDKAEEEFDTKSFLVGINDDVKPATYFIFKDEKLRIEPW
jgi:hypothetical protein